MMRGVVVVVCLSGAGCFSKPPPPTGHGLDGPVDVLVDAPGDDAGMCGSWRPFGVAEPVAGLVLPNIIEPTMSSDGRDVIYRNSSSLEEATRTNVGGSFDPSNVVTGLIGSDLRAAWLSPNRMRLYVVEGGQLFETNRTTGNSFVLGPVEEQDVQDATLFSDESFVVWATTAGILVDSAPGVGPLTGLRTVSGVTLSSPSIGDHDRSLVWVESAASPTNSTIYIAGLTLQDGLPKLGQPSPIDLGAGTFNAGTILSADGSALYFTSAPMASGAPQLFVSHRTCN